MLNNREKIATLIPHGNAMSVLDRIIHWDESTLLAETKAHQRKDNPLYDDSISTVLLVEYAAQAAAVHGRLNEAGLEPDRPAYVGAFKNIKIHVAKLSDVIGVLTIRVVCVLSETGGAIYEMHIRSQKGMIIEGRLVLVARS